jgi:hypothetical protein
MEPGSWKYPGGKNPIFFNQKNKNIGVTGHLFFLEAPQGKLKMYILLNVTYRNIQL